MTGDEETLLDIVVGGVAVDGASVGVKSSSRRERVKHCSAADVLLLRRAHNLLVIDALYTYNRRWHRRSKDEKCLRVACADAGGVVNVDERVCTVTVKSTP